MSTAIMSTTTGIVYVRSISGTITLGYIDSTVLDTSASAVTSTVPISVAQGTAAAPGIYSTGDATTGLFGTGAGWASLFYSFAGTAKWVISGAGANMRLASTFSLEWQASADVNSGGTDVVLSRGAANRLDLASGDSFQTVDGTITALRPGIATTSTNGLIASNATAATGGATVQMSPRVFLRGNAWDTSASQTVDFFLENLPATAATPTGTFKLGYSLNGAAATYPLTVDSTGILTTLSSIVSGANITIPADSALSWSGRTVVRATSASLLSWANSAENAGIGFNFATDGILKVRNRVNSAYATVDALAYQLSGVVTFSGTAPTIASGFGTTPSIAASNGTAAFTVNVGTGGTADTGVITLPAATTGWALSCINLTNSAIAVTAQTASTTTSATIANYSRTTGLLTAWTASDIISITAVAY